MESQWLLLLPPVVTFALAITTRRVVIALLAGCLLAGLINTDFSIPDAFFLVGQKFLNTSQFNQWTSWEGVGKAANPQICLFVIISGILICAIEKTGGYKAFNGALEKYVHEKQQAELAAVTLSHCVSLDGYLSTLTVGSVMRPLIDKFESTRIKLAFIARFLAVAICSINPFSTWMALILLQLNAAGIHADNTESVVTEDPFSIYFMIIPFMFYSLLSSMSVWFVVSRQISFGTMGQLEHSPPQVKARTKQTHETINPAFEPNLLDFFFPIIALVLFIFCAFLYSGGWVGFGGNASILHAMEHIQVAPSLLFGSLIATLAYFLYMNVRGAMSWKHWWPIAKHGAVSMLSSLAILNLAWTFGALEIHAEVIQGLIKSFIPKDVEFIWLPLVFFISALGTSMAIGSSWATIGLLFPIVTATIVALESHPIPFELFEVPLLLPTLGAVVSGAVAGDQLSPISDSSFIVSASTQCRHGDHVNSQFTYGFPVIFCTAIAYAISGWLSISSTFLAVVIPLAVGIMLATLYFDFRHRHSRYRFATKATLG